MAKTYSGTRYRTSWSENLMPGPGEKSEQQITQEPATLASSSIAFKCVKRTRRI